MSFPLDELSNAFSMEGASPEAAQQEKQQQKPQQPHHSAAVAAEPLAGDETALFGPFRASTDYSSLSNLHTTEAGASIQAAVAPATPFGVSDAFGEWASASAAEHQPQQQIQHYQQQQEQEQAFGDLGNSDGGNHPFNRGASLRDGNQGSVAEVVNQGGSDSDTTINNAQSWNRRNSPQMPVDAQAPASFSGIAAALGADSGRSATTTDAPADTSVTIVAPEPAAYTVRSSSKEFSAIPRSPAPATTPASATESPQMRVLGDAKAVHLAAAAEEASGLQGTRSHASSHNLSRIVYSGALNNEGAVHVSAPQDSTVVTEDSTVVTEAAPEAGSPVAFAALASAASPDEVRVSALSGDPSKASSPGNSPSTGVETSISSAHSTGR